MEARRRLRKPPEMQVGFNRTAGAASRPHRRKPNGDAL
jgi:hypothetical protein